MSTTTMGIMTLAGLLLAGCQTVQQTAEARTKLACFQAGYGETSPQHAECVRTMLPIAQQMEFQRRLNGAMDGLDMVAAGVSRR